MGASGKKLGTGAYFSTTPQLAYGSKMTEWYANVSKIFNYSHT